MILKDNQFRRSSQIKSILLMVMLIGTVITALQITGPSSASAVTSYTVKVYKSGSTYYAATSTGKIITQGTSASSVINSAFRSLTSGGIAYIQAGIYPISSQLIVPNLNNVAIIGDSGTVLQATATIGSILVFTGTSSRHASGLTMSNLVFDCNLKASCLNIKWCDRVTLNGLEIENTRKVQYGNGLEIKGSSGSVISGVTITNCYIHNIYGSGINLAYASDCKVNSNTFVDCAQYYPSGGAVHADDGCQRITVQNNDISGRSDNDGIYVGTERSFASGCVITGNTISLRLYGTGGGANYAGSGIKVYTTSSDISGNTINWNSMPYVYAIEDWGAGNNIHDNSLGYARVGVGLFAVSGKPTGSNIIKANQITHCTYGIDINQSGNTISTNIFTSCKTATSG